MQLIVTVDKSYIFDVPENISGYELKHIISEKLNIPYHRFYLTFNSKVLNNRKLEDYNISESSTIWLSFRSNNIK